jgi:hypothetical protein
VDPATAEKPLAHVAQVLSDEAPATALADPAAQSTHSTPSESENLPAAHCEHALTLPVETNPPTHATHTLEPDSLSVWNPAPHVEHIERPSAGANVPSAHGTHAPLVVARGAPFAVPAGHLSQLARSAETNSPSTQRTHELDALGADQPDSHGMQSASDEAPLDAAKVPAGQGSVSDWLGDAYQPGVLCVHPSAMAAET